MLIFIELNEMVDIVLIEFVKYADGDGRMLLPYVRNQHRIQSFTPLKSAQKDVVFAHTVRFLRPGHFNVSAWIVCSKTSTDLETIRLK